LRFSCSPNIQEFHGLVIGFGLEIAAKLSSFRQDNNFPLFSDEELTER